MLWRRIAVLPKGLEEIVGEIVVLGVVLHLVGFRLLRVASGRETQDGIGIERVRHPKPWRKRVIGECWAVLIAQQQVAVLAVGMYGLHRMRRNRAIDGAVEADERHRRPSAGRRLWNEIRRQRLRVIAELALPGEEPEVLSVVGSVGEVIFVDLVAQADVDVELVGRVPKIFERQRGEVRRDVVDESPSRPYT